MAELQVASERVREFLKGDEQAAYHVVKGDLHAACLMLAAKAQGIAVDTLPPSEDSKLGRPWMRMHFSDKTVYFNAGAMLVGPVGAPLAACRPINGNALAVIDDKRACKDLIRILGLPAPDGITLRRRDEEKAVAWFRQSGRPACVKANRRGHGTDVHPGLKNEAALRSAFRKVAARNAVFLIEEHWDGPAIRFFYLRPDVIAVRMDLPANVTGDGSSDIASLIAAKNAEKTRRTGHTPVEIDDDVMAHLAAAHLTLADILPAGQRIMLRSVSNGTKGGDSYEYNDAIHPSYVEAVGRMCNAIQDLLIAAVDTKIPDPAEPARPDNFTILEVNNRPGLVPYHFPWEGRPRDISAQIVAALQRKGWCAP